LVDHTSAAVLRTDTQFTRAIGPGVHFSQRGEWLAEPLDLRPQKRRARGHKPSTDQPPAPEGVSTQALTHDGIPIATDLSVTFMLDPGHRQVPRSGRREDRSPYEYNPVSAERAVYAHAYGEFEDLPWTALPLRLAVDLWREIVKTYTLEKLLGQDRGTIPPMQQIKARIETRLSSATVDVLDSHGRRVAQESREFQILAARGVRVLAVGGMTALYLPDDIRLERTRIWQEKWAGSIQSSLAQADEQVRQARRDGELKAGELLLRDLTRELAGELSSNRAPGRRDTLRLVLQSAIRLCAHHPELLDRSALSMQLTEVLRELETLDDDCRAVGSGGAG
jgi:hypothetical protein